MLLHVVAPLVPMPLLVGVAAAADNSAICHGAADSGKGPVEPGRSDGDSSDTPACTICQTLQSIAADVPPPAAIAGPGWRHRSSSIAVGATEPARQVWDRPHIRGPPHIS
jgi:hypothetical protein